MKGRTSYGTMHRMSCLLRGATLLRILMNEALAQMTLRGRVIDIGGGHHPNYFEYFQRSGDVKIEVVDGSISGVDFEKDALPFPEKYADTIVLCNVLEHVYNHRFLLAQVHRVLKKDAQLIGFVPFWVGYHPDPHDYFRYTDEALLRLLRDTGFSDIAVKRIGAGPILANFNTIVLSVPPVARPLLYCAYAVLDAVFVYFRPHSVERNPLGYLFYAKRSV